MKIAVTLVACVFSLALALVSVPWLLWGLGRAALGDEAGCDRAFEICPLGRFLDRVEA